MAKQLIDMKFHSFPSKTSKKPVCQTKVDLEKALHLPHLVKSGQFTLRTSVLKKGIIQKKREIRSAPITKEPADNEFQQFLLDRKKIKRSKEEVLEQTLLKQHKDVWTDNFHKLRTGSGLLTAETETIIPSLLKDISSADSAKKLIQGILDQLNQSYDYHLQLRASVERLHNASRKTASRKGRTANKLEYQKAKIKIDSLRKLIMEGMGTLEAEYNDIESEISKLRDDHVQADSFGTNDIEFEKELSWVKKSERYEEDSRPTETILSPDISTSPDLLSSDSGFRTDDGCKNTLEESGAQLSEITDTTGDCEDDGLDSDNAVSIKDEPYIYSEKENGLERDNSKRYERFDISFSEDGEVITHTDDFDATNFPSIEYKQFISNAMTVEDNITEEEIRETQSNHADSINNQYPDGLTSAMIELEKYFHQPRRWDIFDIDEVDEDNISPVTNSPIAICTRVTPLDQLGIEKEDTSDGVSMSLNSETGSLSDLTSDKDVEDEEEENFLNEELLKKLDLDVKMVSLPFIKPVEQLLSVKGETISVQGTAKFTSAFSALEKHYKTKLMIITERLKKHEEDRPKFLTKDLKLKLKLIKSMYPKDHPNYTTLWIDMFSRLVQPKVAHHDVKLADLWIRERMHLENQMIACRSDMERELERLENRIRKVVNWMADKSKEQEARKDEIDGQKLICERLHDELSMMQAYKSLKDDENRRHEALIQAKKEEIRLAKVEEERLRREKQRNEIELWRRNKIDVQNVARLQLEDELRVVLREKEVQGKKNEDRIKYRLKVMEEKKLELSEKKKEELDDLRERSARLEGLRKFARRRLGVHIMPADKTRLIQLTEAAQGKIYQPGSINHEASSVLTPLFPINSWSQDDISKDQRVLLEQELRERGLLNNEYAMKQILTLAPPTNPRKDTKSTIVLGKK